MTGEEIVALSKKHTIFEWSAQGAVDPIPVARAQGRLLLDAGRQALHRLQQPADVREHRPRRSRGSSRPFRSRPRRWPMPIRSWRPSRGRGSARSWRRSPRATSTSSSSPTAAPRPTRTRSRSRAPFTGRQKILARYRSYHGGTAGGDRRDRRSAALVAAADAGRRSRARSRITASSAAGTTPPTRSPTSRK